MQLKKTGAEDLSATDAKWHKCRDPELTPDQLKALLPALKLAEKSEYYQSRYPRGKYYAFAHRVCRAYVTEWLKQDSDPRHINRENLARSAVSKVYGQVRPWSDKPHHGNTNMGKVTLLPIIERVLSMPSYDYKPGTPGWLTKITTLNR